MIVIPAQTQTATPASTATRLALTIVRTALLATSSMLFSRLAHPALPTAPSVHPSHSAQCANPASI